MNSITVFLSATSTILGLIFFIGIVYWAYSSHSREANEASAKLPFELPDEFKKDVS